MVHCEVKGGQQLDTSEHSGQVTTSAIPVMCGLSCTLLNGCLSNPVVMALLLHPANASPGL